MTGQGMASCPSEQPLDQWYTKPAPPILAEYHYLNHLLSHSMWVQELRESWLNEDDSVVQYTSHTHWLSLVQYCFSMVHIGSGIPSGKRLHHYGKSPFY